MDDEFFRRDRAHRNQRAFRIVFYGPVLISLVCFAFPTSSRTLAISMFGERTPVQYIVGALMAALAIMTWLMRYLELGVTEPFGWLARRKAGSFDGEGSADQAAQATAARSRSAEESEQGNVQVYLRADDTDVIFRESIGRLNAEIAALGRRNSANLSFGFIAATGGVGLLATSLLATPATTDVTAFALQFIPKVTLVSLVELFAYFFLGLYRNGLSEIKYYQNELTSVESRHAALVAAKAPGMEKTFSNVVCTISKVERNHILEKGQTTAVIELARLDSESVRSHIASLTKAAGVLGGQKKEG